MSNAVQKLVAAPVARRSAGDPPRLGFPVVLSADRTLGAGYRVLFEGMVSASQTSRTPSLLMKGLLAPAGPRDEGLRARQAPLGLRRVESAAVRGGWDRRDVAVVGPASLDRAVGPATRIIGLSSGDPLGVGMNSTTMSGILGGEIYVSRWFRRLAARVGRLRRRAPQARLLMGGPGAWQLAHNPAARKALGIDHVVLGYCEGNAAELFDRIADGDDLPAVLAGEGVAPEAVPPILGPTVMGSVEVSRGCGLGCGFCTLGHEPMGHLPADAILADAQTNVAGGVPNVVLVTEDVFRYGARAGRVQPQALIDLLHRLRALPGLRLIQTDHANVTSVAQYADEELVEVRRAMTGGGRHDYVWLNLGVETASGALLAANGGRPKMGSCGPEAWGAFCLDQVGRLIRLGYFPLVSLVMGLPGETPADVQQTLEWVRRLRGERLAVFPVFHAPLDGRTAPFGLSDMSDVHWRLFRESYRLNFKWVPRLFWDNQSAGGVPLWRRAALQALGRGQTLYWNALFAWRSGRIRA
jgi:radical SAM superfamily enzyme YgiQ (UPF0313 family)